MVDRQSDKIGAASNTRDQDDPPVTRVNSTNVLDEGLRIGRSRASDELEGKDQLNKTCIENKRGGKLGLLSICHWLASPGPYI
jgi:hypothetical protein